MSILKNVRQFFSKLIFTTPAQPSRSAQEQKGPQRRDDRGRREGGQHAGRQQGGRVRRDGKPPDQRERSERAGQPGKTGLIGQQQPPPEKQERHGRGERREKPERRERGDRPRQERGPRPPRPTDETVEVEPGLPHQWDPASFDVPPEEGKVRFHDLDLPPAIMHAVADLGFKYCTPIQAGILGKTLEGADATGRAQTGTGKTAAFLITILTRFERNPAPSPRKKGTPRALVIAPTRELVVQIEKDAKGLSKYMRCKTVAVFGGMDYDKQRRVLGEGAVDIVAATPGRLLDYKRRGDIDLSQVEILIIDEADRMLDMGFIPDVRRIIESTPMKGKRQTMFFSATLTPEVSRLANSWTREPFEVDVTPPREVTVASIDQMVYIITNDEKFTLLHNMITKHQLERVMVFANRRDETLALKEKLHAHGISCGLLSGDVSQELRLRTLEAFRTGKIKVLVATDVAARGLHIEGVSHVVNFSLPQDAEDYVHRIGRTGRAGASGISVSFATETEAYEIPSIEQYIGRELRAVTPEPELLTPIPPPEESAAAEGATEGGGGRAPRPQHHRGGRPRRRGGRGRGSQGRGPQQGN
jgi:ATP-dependent RNA helicase RhlB